MASSKWVGGYSICRSDSCILVCYGLVYYGASMFLCRVPTASMVVMCLLASSNGEMIDLEDFVHNRYICILVSIA